MSNETQDDYPRPDFRRERLRWQSLNGPWNFLFDDDDIGASRQWQRNSLPDHVSNNEGKTTAKTTIQVPFVFQSRASGINEQGVHEILWYERHITDIRTNEENHLHYRLLLRFGAVDYYAEIWVDGQFVGDHRGGHVPFDLDITDHLTSQPSAEHRLTIRVYDSATDLTQPRGKQYWGPKPESIYYTPSSGIWQNVWLESAPEVRIADSSHGTILRSNKLEDGCIDCRIAILGRRTRQSYSIQMEASLEGVMISKSQKWALPPDENFIKFDHVVRLTEGQLQQLPQTLLQQASLDNSTCWQNGVALWSPEYPLLYNLEIRLLDADDRVVEEVKTTTGMRSINWTAGDGTFRLNGQPYFQALLLDQGYWPDSLMTPPNQLALKKDIELCKKMGFQGVRKHQKVEDPTFLYWADKLGFLVWGEMASSYKFSNDYMDRFNQEWMEMVRRDINHPCAVAWTPVNESWGYPDLGHNIGQRNHIRSLYYMTKTLDPTRPINDNCGWEHVLTDLSTFHDYADAEGMAERCKSVEDILQNGKSMFLGKIQGPDGACDEGSRHQIGAPVICTEFGGVNIANFNDSERTQNWGYTTAKDSEDLLRRVENIIMATVKEGNVCGIVWTQL